jgi:hypothetical protein
MAAESRGALMLVRGPDPLETLPRSIRRPSLFRSGRWVACPLPESAKPDVTRLEVVMWLPVADDDGELPSWDEVAAALGAPQPAGPLTVPLRALEALTPALVPVARVEAQRATVLGAVYPSRGFHGHGSTLARAVRVDGGLLVALATT